MNKVFLFLSSVIFIILLAGCGDAAYNKLIDKADGFIEDEKYAEAHDTLEDALEEKENDAYATDTIAQLDIFMEVLENIGEEKPKDSIDQLHKLSTYKEGSELLMDLAEQYSEQLQTIDQLYTQIDRLEKDNNYEEAIEKVNNTLENKADALSSFILKQYSQPLDNLKEELATYHLFSMMKGYVRNQTDRTGITYCQVSDEDMVCSTVDVGIFGWRDIVDIHKEDEDSLRIETNHERDLSITNIEEDSFTLDGDHYTQVTAEELKEQLRIQSTSNKLLDKKGMDELIEFTQVDYFDLSSDIVAEEQEEELKQYSEQEIEHALVWIYYYKSLVPSKESTFYPELNVSIYKKGNPVAPDVYDEEGINFKADIYRLNGEFGADGQISYTSNGDGTVNIYDIPRKWPAEYELEGGVKAFTEKIINNPEKIELPEASTEELLPILETMEIHI